MTEDHPACLGCGAPLTRSLIDLGVQPLANSYVPLHAVGHAEPKYPLHARVCDACLLVQVEKVVPPEEIFSDYAYFSSYSDSWVAHVKSYVEMVIQRFALNATSKVIEIASNDGYLLQHVVHAGIPCLGVEPAENVAKAAWAKGVPTDVSFFGRATAERLVEQGHAADLVICKNVLAHVPDINDFVAGIAILLKPEAVHTVEFPHLLNLIEKTQFDTIYHEHFSYLSLLAVIRLFARHGLRVFDVEEMPTHGGSLRVFACRDGASHARTGSVDRVLDRERSAALDRPEGYSGFEARVKRVREEFTSYLDAARSKGRTILGYGAAAKGNTFLNYCGVTADQIAFVVDRNPVKQNTLLPGSRIPVLAPEALDAAQPADIVILPWNIRDEVAGQLVYLRDRGARFITAIPALSILDCDASANSHNHTAFGS
ncbi:class I SAM-dependent methyltransferase [Microvirga subterranea]|uniref:Methyltransferase family protein n=1 Tax=Microvirga subterranea TaxID=186651 RepID=A0A370HE40_9HYPH|nr:class I SAM-dependent methyltransferase [Microvirga subterranea]RDI54841.1 methyltransferase family protein [Microvirga subterranea]